LITQDRFADEKCRDERICGSAMFTMVASRTTIS